ncbi:MAG: efflux RND transporter permease subunit [Lentisphaeraceae bacterium]|nr:efflux RND transporter permease subunit [Lentisphaeraceae bacterium]
MLNHIIAFALKNRLLIVVFSLLIALSGSYIAKQMPVDVLPDLNRPMVVVMTEAHAMVPEDVETLVTTPLEQILNGATGVERVTSSSGLGLSVVKVEFAWGSDVYRNRQIIAEKLVLAKNRLPKGTEPQMAPISSIMGQIQFIGLSSKSGKFSQEEIRALADFELKYDLLSIPGISKVIVAGGSSKQLQVIMDPAKLREFEVTPQEISSAISKNNMNSSGGFINISTTAPVITVNGMLKNKDELENAVVKPDSLRPIRIKDVANITFGPSIIKIGDIGVNGKPGVLLVVMKQPGFDTVKLTEKVEEVLKQKSLSIDPDLTINPELFKQADFIDRAIKNVMDAVRDGGILVVIILFVFLMNWRTTFITLTAIPMSIAITAIIFSILGIGINTMTLGGLAVAIGALVDDAIVDVENVYRRLNQNKLKTNKVPPLKVIFTASSEVRKPIVIGTLLVVVVYVPLFFLTGMEGKLFVPIGIAYIVSVISSLLVSLTLTPALCYYLLPKNLAKHDSGDTLLVRKLKAVIAQFIEMSIKNAKALILLLVLGTVAGVYTLVNTGSQFLPAFNEGVAQVNLVLPPETGLKTSNEYGQRLEKLLTSIDGVKYVTRRTGRAEGDEHAEGVSTSEVIVTFDSSKNRDPEDIKAEIRTKFAQEFPGVAMAIDQPLAHLLSAMLSGVKAQVAVKVFGPDLDTLRSLAKEVEGHIKNVEGVKDLMIEPQVLVPNIAIKPNREKLARHGLAVEDVAEFIELTLGGEEVSKLVEGRFIYPIVLRLEEKDRKDLEQIKNLYIRKHDDSLIRLKDVAEIRTELTSNSIKHENVGRRIVIQHNVAGKSLGEVVNAVNKALDPVRAKISNMKGYSLKLSGQFEAQEAATKRILALSILSLFAMVFILYAHFGSLNLSLQVLASIPMAFIGAVIFIKLTNQTISVATLVGLISLGGIATRNAILLLDHYMFLLKEEGMKFSKEMIIKAGQERMIPVLMTALTSGIALVPLALSPGQPGKEILYPVATVIIGGLISSTLLDFIIRPALFSIFGEKACEKVLSPEKETEEIKFF